MPWSYLASSDWIGFLKDKSPEFIIFVLGGVFLWKVVFPLVNTSIAASNSARDQAFKELERVRKEATDSILSARQQTMSEVIRVLASQEMRVLRSLDARDEVNKKVADILVEVQRELLLIRESK